MQTKLYKIPKFGVNRPKSKQDNVKIYKEMYGHIRTLSDPVSRYYGRTFLFFNFDVFKSLYLNQN